MLSLLLLTSCQEKQNIFYVPTIGVEGRGDNAQYGDAPIQVSGSEYQIYSGSPYMGDEGRAVNSHYTPYNQREHNYNHYRGEE